MTFAHNKNESYRWYDQSDYEPIIFAALSKTNNSVFLPIDHANITGVDGAKSSLELQDDIQDFIKMANESSCKGRIFPLYMTVVRIYQNHFNLLIYDPNLKQAVLYEFNNGRVSFESEKKGIINAITRADDSIRAEAKTVGIFQDGNFCGPAVCLMADVIANAYAKEKEFNLGKVTTEWAREKLSSQKLLSRKNSLLSDKEKIAIRDDQTECRNQFINSTDEASYAAVQEILESNAYNFGEVWAHAIAVKCPQFHMLSIDPANEEHLATLHFDLLKIAEKPTYTLSDCQNAFAKFLANCITTQFQIQNEFNILFRERQLLPKEPKRAEAPKREREPLKEPKPEVSFDSLKIKKVKLEADQIEEAVTRTYSFFEKNESKKDPKVEKKNPIIETEKYRKLLTTFNLQDKVDLIKKELASNTIFAEDSGVKKTLGIGKATIFYGKNNEEMVNEKTAYERDALLALELQIEEFEKYSKSKRLK